MEMTIEEIIAHCDRQLSREPKGSIFYREHEAVKAFLMELQEFRNIGMKPERLKQIGCLFSDDSCVGMDFISSCIDAAKHGISADRLRELAEAERDGRLVSLPCKVGDTVWVVDCEYMDCNNCDHLEHGKYCPYLDKPVCPNGTIRQGRFYYSLIPDFGKTVFLTRAEAEQKLHDIKSELDAAASEHEQED